MVTKLDGGGAILARNLRVASAATLRRARSSGKTRLLTVTHETSVKTMTCVRTGPAGYSRSLKLVMQTRRSVAQKPAGGYGVSGCGGGQYGSGPSAWWPGSAAGAGWTMASATRRTKLRIVAAATRFMITVSSRAPSAPNGGR